LPTESHVVLPVLDWVLVPIDRRDLGAISCWTVVLQYRETRRLVP
jgi:hypothetical protein